MRPRQNKIGNRFLISNKKWKIRRNGSTIRSTIFINMFGFALHWIATLNVVKIVNHFKFFVFEIREIGSPIINKFFKKEMKMFLSAQSFSLKDKSMWKFDFLLYFDQFYTFCQIMKSKISILEEHNNNGKSRAFHTNAHFNRKVKNNLLCFDAAFIKYAQNFSD